MLKSDLPFGSEFSPSQVELPDLLDMAVRTSGDWRALEKAIRVRYFDSHKGTSDYNRAKLANNTKLGMIAYGIYDRATSSLTPFGQKLHSLRNDEHALYAELARHILLNLNGMALVQCVQDIQSAGEAIDLVKLREWLEERGIHFPRGGKHPSMMRLWLERAGVFSSGWRTNESRLAKLTGLSQNDVEALAGLTPRQRAFVKALVNMGGPGPYASNDIEKLASATYGVKFNEKGLPKDVLYPLEKLGYVRLVRGTKAGGRGAKPFEVYSTDKLVCDVVTPLLQQMEKQTGADLRPLLRKPLPQIVSEMASRDKHVRGLALEAFAFKLMRLIDLNYVATRLRGIATGGAEVDLIFESDRLVFSRWQVQCKNTARVNLDDVAKEVGLVHMLKGDVILMACLGRISSKAREFAQTVARQKPIRFVFLSGEDLKTIAARPSSMVDRILGQDQLALTVKNQPAAG